MTSQRINRIGWFVALLLWWLLLSAIRIWIGPVR